MLLTVFLIGLTASMVAINIRQDDDDIANLEARRFAALIGQLQDESTLAGRPMGVQVSEGSNRYRFWELNAAWNPIEQISVLRERVVPEPVTIALDLLQGKRPVDQQSDDAQGVDQTKPNQVKVPKALIVVEPNGLTGPFVVSFRGDSKLFNVTLDNQMLAVVSNVELD